MSDTPESPELAQLRAERNRLVAEREEREQKRAAEAEVASLKQSIADEEAIAKAEAEHGTVGSDIAVVHSRGGNGVIIVKRPSHPVYRQMIDAVGTGKEKLSVINERFAFQVIVHPSKDEFERILKRESGLLDRVANAAAVLAGLVIEEVGGK